MASIAAADMKAAITPILRFVMYRLFPVILNATSLKWDTREVFVAPSLVMFLAERPFAISSLVLFALRRALIEFLRGDHRPSPTTRDVVDVRSLASAPHPGLDLA